MSVWITVQTVSEGLSEDVSLRVFVKNVQKRIKYFGQQI